MQTVKSRFFSHGKIRSEQHIPGHLDPVAVRSGDHVRAHRTDPARHPAGLSGPQGRSRTAGDDPHGAGHGRRERRRADLSRRHAGKPLSRSDGHGHRRADEHPADRLLAAGLYLHLQQRPDSLSDLYGHRNDARYQFPAGQAVAEHVPRAVRRAGDLRRRADRLRHGAEPERQRLDRHGGRSGRADGALRVAQPLEGDFRADHRRRLPLSGPYLRRLSLSGAGDGSQAPAGHPDEAAQKSAQAVRSRDEDFVRCRDVRHPVPALPGGRTALLLAFHRHRHQGVGAQARERLHQRADALRFDLLPGNSAGHSLRRPHAARSRGAQTARAGHPRPADFGTTIRLRSCWPTRLEPTSRGSSPRPSSPRST